MWQFIALEIKEKNGMKGVYASINFKKGESIFTLTGPISDEQTRTSIKVGENLHIEDKFGAFINHNCDPTVKIQGRKVIAVKNIKHNDEITFDYSLNEGELVYPFVCVCCGSNIV